MTADLAIEVLLYGGLIPAAIAIAIIYLVRHLLSEGIAERNAMAAGFALAFFAGYAILPSWASLWPQRHWQWLPHLAVVAMVLGPVGLARGVSIAERWLLWLLLAIVAAWCVVPSWKTLDPPRQFYVPVLAGYLFLLTALLEPLARRFSARLLLAHAFLAASAVAILLVDRVASLVYGQIAGIAASVTAGCFAAACLYPSVAMLRGMIPALAMLIGGLAFIGFIEPRQPLFGMLLLPAAPLALWAAARGPLARLRGTSAIAIQTSLVLAVLAVGAILVEMAP